MNSNKMKLEPLFDIENKKTINNNNTKKEQKIRFLGILGFDCGEVEPYVGTNKQLIEKGFIVNNGIPTLRGFAKISELAKASKAKYEEYQRPKYQDHIDEIANFLKGCKTEAKFLPEVVLSVNSSEKAILTKYNHRSFANASATLKGVIGNMDYYSLDVEEGALSRVDGNHRLEAGKNQDYYVPFSIIVWNINPENEDNLLYIDSSENNTESEAFLFYILNNTAKRLEAEENFKGLVQSQTWSSEELATINQHLPILKHYYQTFDKNPLLEKDILSKPLSQICEILTDINDSTLGIDKFDTIFKDTIILLNQLESFYYCKKQFSNILFQLAFYTRYKSNNLKTAITNLKFINKWLEKYKYTGTTFTKASKLFDVAYNYILSSPKTIFMAMEYKSKQIVEACNKALNRVVKEINSLNGTIKVEAYPIMTGKGRSHSIIADIYKKIDECSIFIADITENNPNVLYELGIAFSKSKPLLIVLEKNKKGKYKIPSDILLEYRHEFNSISELENLLVKNIKVILENDYGAVFLDKK